MTKTISLRIREVHSTIMMIMTLESLSEVFVCLFVFSAENDYNIDSQSVSPWRQISLGVNSTKNISITVQILNIICIRQCLADSDAVDDEVLEQIISSVHLCQWQKKS